MNEEAPLLEQIDRQEARFTQLAAWVVETARDMEALGRPPSSEILRDLQHSRQKFVELRDRIYDEAVAERLEPLAAREHVTSLQEARELLARVEDSRTRLARLRKRIGRAGEVLGAIEALKTTDETVEAKLGELRAEAADLLARISALEIEADPDQTLLVEVEDLAEDRHPYCMLLSLAGGHEALPDDKWQKLTQEVTSALGPSLAIAAARGRIVAPVSAGVAR